MQQSINERGGDVMSREMQMDNAHGLAKGEGRQGPMAGKAEGMVRQSANDR